MIFLIEYNRRQGRVVSMQQFDDDVVEDAEKIRLDLELDLNHQGIEHEVVILHSSSEDDLRRAYPRYFASFREIVDALSEAADVPLKSIDV